MDRRQPRHLDRFTAWGVAENLCVSVATQSISRWSYQAARGRQYGSRAPPRPDVLCQMGELDDLGPERTLPLQYARWSPIYPTACWCALPDALGVFTGAVGPTLLDPSQYDPLGDVPGTQVPKPDWAVEEYWALILRSR